MRAVSLPADETSGATQPTAPAKARGLWRVLRWFLLLLVVAVAGAALIGYGAGANQRRSSQAGAAERAADEQFQLGEQDLTAGRYEIARQRFEYVIAIDPGYPNVAQRLAEALVGLDEPLATPLPASSPTPNLAPVTDLFSQASTAYANGDWDVVIDTLLALRAKDTTFKAVEVDGMMFAALRNRGLKRIKSEGRLEEGLYDLSLAERFGPLDSEADQYRGWARLYLLANSFVGVNWAEAAYYFGQLYLAAPYLTTDTYLKYAQSTNRYGDELILADNPCDAKDQYAQSLAAWENPDLVPTATKAADRCEESHKPPPATQAAATPTETPPAEAPTDTPTP
jgi:tetratricopeptide (TPR) repeat protein